jgi:glucosamine-6-phosphate deaminase
MEITIARSYEEMSDISAGMIAKEIKRKHDLVLGLATGDTPLGTYQELVKIYKTKVSTFRR